jgi:hypothetical protein
MKWRIAVLYAMPWLALGQLQLSVFDGNSEKAISAITDLGSIQVGDSTEIRFHARNTTAAPLALERLRVSGAGFTLSSAPDLPFVVAASKYVEFRVRFTAATVAAYSAFLTVNEAQVLLRISAVPGATVSLVDDQIGALLTAGATIDFGRVQKGHPATRQLRIANGGTSALTVQTCQATGTAFHLAGLNCPAVLGPGDAALLTVTFDPPVTGAHSGTLTIDNRSFLLSGVGFAPPLPRPSIQFDSTLTSGIQRRLAIHLASVSETAGTGTVTLDFQPLNAAFGDDPSIRFTSTGSRTLSFTVNEGDTLATFPTGVDTTFQTGTTAGTISFRVKLGDYDEQFTFPIAPAAVSIDSASATRRAGNLDVTFTAYDNTRTAGRMSFTFYDTSGRMIQPGAIRADWSDSFASYFRFSKVGGSFVLRATFPVSGDTSLIGGVEVEITNSVSTTRTERISF